MAQPEPLSLAGRRVAFTTPNNSAGNGGGYGGRLHALLRQRGADPLPVPTIAIRAHDPDGLRPFLLPGALDNFAALAFTSRSGIYAFSRALPSSAQEQGPLSDAASALPFTVAALGSAADLLDGEFLTRLCRDAGRITVLVPDVPTPAGLVEALGRGSGRRVLCPVPDVAGLHEPPVVPNFLAGLDAAGWVVVRAPAYTTCWAGPGCVEGLVAPDAVAPDAIVFTSSAEVEGLLKGLDAVGWSWPRLRARWPDMVVAAHGPVTAEDVRRLGIEVDVEATLNPAINGTLNVLRLCKKKPFLKRVVLTSSSSAVRIRDESQHPTNSLDETVWSSAPLCEKLQLWYALAKIYAEKAAWDFAKENNIDLVTVLPSFVIGPSLSHELCTTASDILGLIQGDTDRFTSYGRMGYVHIDDVACSHILVYETPEATGRYLCSSVVLDNNELVGLLAKQFPVFPVPRRLKNPYGKQSYQLNISKLQGLGFKFKGVEEMFEDCIESLKDQGHLLECPL